MTPEQCADAVLEIYDRLAKRNKDASVPLNFGQLLEVAVRIWEAGLAHDRDGVTDFIEGE